MQDSNAQNNEPIKNVTPSWIVVLMIVIAVLAIGSIVYTWQNSGSKDMTKSLQEQITVLQNQITQLQQTQTNQNTQLDPVVENTTEETENNLLMYTNTQYGFSLTFPETWRGYFAKNNTSMYAYTGAISSIAFGLPLTQQDDVFSVEIFTKNAWENKEDGPANTQIYLGESDQYVFAYTAGMRDVPSEFNTIRRALEKEVKNIILTFKTTK